MDLVFAMPNKIKKALIRGLLNNLMIIFFQGKYIYKAVPQEAHQ